MQELLFFEAESLYDMQKQAQINYSNLRNFT